ncbi:GSCFA domain-containing protein [soil metagenome]
MTTSPYSSLPKRQFWRTGVRDADWTTIDDLYRKKFPIEKTTKIMTAGSCFAQHIGRNMKKNGYLVIDEERAPSIALPDAAKEYGYGIYSARYGNIYTARQLLQLIREAFGRRSPKDIVWEKDGRFYDALRPAVEPNGHASPAEVLAHREDHLARVRAVVHQADLLIFTFGLTEAWIHKESGTVYPTAPGTIAGNFDPAVHAFINFTYDDVLSDFERVRRVVQRRRPDIRFLVTVSPVPLTATAANDHVLCSTMHSKSILRAVAGTLTARYPDIDYFPSYEVIGSPFVGSFYDDTKRSVTDEGVSTVMSIFFREHGTADAQETKEARANGQAPKQSTMTPPSRDDVVCEEVLLDAFA